MTSCLGKSFPEGMRLGTVKKIDKNVSGISMAITIKPFVDTFEVEEVLVVKKR